MQPYFHGFCLKTFLFLYDKVRESILPRPATVIVNEFKQGEWYSQCVACRALRRSTFSGLCPQCEINVNEHCLWNHWLCVNTLSTLSRCAHVPGSRQNCTPIEIGPMGPFLTAKLDWGRSNSNACKWSRHHRLTCKQSHHKVHVLDDMRTLLSVYKLLSLTALGL